MGSGYSKPSSKVEYNRYKDATKSGKAFTTKESATADFKAKYGSQYTSSFKTEPASRPSYIPSRYRYNGRDVDIVYNPGMGYGYWNGGGPGLGTFLLYDAISDAANAAMISNAMANRGYYVGAVPPKPFPLISCLIITTALIGGAVFLIIIFNR